MRCFRENSFRLSQYFVSKEVIYNNYLILNAVEMNHETNSIPSVNFVWLFQGEASNFSAAVFSNLHTAEKWIEDSKVTGVLTKYPLDTSVYDWAVSTGDFIPQQTYQKEPKFIQKFSNCSSLEHYHFENGIRCS